MLTETKRTYATSLKDNLLRLRQTGPKKGVEITYIYYSDVSTFWTPSIQMFTVFRFRKFQTDFAAHQKDVSFRRSEVVSIPQNDIQIS